jgi:hypothetical protein
MMQAEIDAEAELMVDLATTEAEAEAEEDRRPDDSGIEIDSDDEYKGQLVPVHYVVNKDNRFGCISRTRLRSKVKLIYNERGKAGQQLGRKKEKP